MTRPQSNIIHTFNTASLKTLNSAEREKVMAADVAPVSLVMIFDKDTPAREVSNTVYEAARKTSIGNFTLVSRNENSNVQPYKATQVAEPLSIAGQYFSSYGSLNGIFHLAYKNEKEGRPVPESLKRVESEYAQEFHTNTNLAWHNLTKPPALVVPFSGKTPITQDMNPEDIGYAIQHAFQASLHKTIVSAVEAQQAERKKTTFLHAEDHKDLKNALTEGSVVQTFAHFSMHGERTQGQREQRAMGLSQILGVPVVTEQNLSSVIALPHDTHEDVTNRTDAVLKRRLGILAG